MPLGVARNETAFAWLNPDLQKVQRRGWAGIEFTVRDTATGAHELNLARLKHAAIAHAVLVLQHAFQHIAENFHVAMRMRAKALTGVNTIIVDDSQRPEADLGRVVIIGKRKGVIYFNQPWSAWPRSLARRILSSVAVVFMRAVSPGALPPANAGYLA